MKIEVAEETEERRYTVLRFHGKNGTNSISLKRDEAEALASDLAITAAARVWHSQRSGPDKMSSEDRLLWISIDVRPPK